jgi:hypothetical protein
MIVRVHPSVVMLALNPCSFLFPQGKLELEETVKVFKQSTHVMRFFDDPTAPRAKKDFLTDFLEGQH